MVALLARPPLDVDEIVKAFARPLAKLPPETHDGWLDRLAALDHLATRETAADGAVEVKLSKQMQALVAEMAAEAAKGA